MKPIFKNLSEGRLKAGWRITLFVILFWILSSSIFLIKPLFKEISKRDFLNNYSLLIVAILSISATVAVALARKNLDKRNIKSLGLKVNKQSLKDLVFGFLLSGVMAAAFLGIASMLGLVEINSFEFVSLEFARSNSTSYVDFISYFSVVFLMIVLIEHVLVGYWEELVFRGYLFQNMKDGLGLVWAIIISCLLYGLIHSANPNATILSTIIIVIFGFLRLYGYLITNMLWLSMGMHIGWNFFQGPIFGFAASGHQHATLIKLNINDPNWLSGGSFGPEGSILIIPILFLALSIMRIWGGQSKVNY